MGPFSTMAVLRPFAAAAEAIIIPEPEPMTRTSNLSIIIHDRKRTKHQINFSNGATLQLENLISIFFVLKHVRNMSKTKKAEAEKKKKVYYEKKEKKATEVKKK
jgi:hypothetical protein